MFLNMAPLHMCDTNVFKNVQNPANNTHIENTEVLGIQKFKVILASEARKSQISSFAWGSMDKRNIDLNEVDQTFNTDHTK